MPDTSLIRQLSKDFNISLDELFDGKYKKNMEDFIHKKTLKKL